MIPIFIDRDISDRLMNIRISRGLTQTEMAKILDINRSTYTNWELGNRRIPQWLTPRLREMFEISELWFLLGEGPEVITPGLDDEYNSVINLKKRVKYLEGLCLNIAYQLHKIKKEHNKHL